MHGYVIAVLAMPHVGQHVATSHFLWLVIMCANITINALSLGKYNATLVVGVNIN